MQSVVDSVLDCVENIKKEVAAFEKDSAVVAHTSRMVSDVNLLASSVRIGGWSDSMRSAAKSIEEELDAKMAALHKSRESIEQRRRLMAASQAEIVRVMTILLRLHTMLKFAMTTPLEAEDPAAEAGQDDPLLRTANTFVPRGTPLGDFSYLNEAYDPEPKRAPQPYHGPEARHVPIGQPGPSPASRPARRLDLWGDQREAFDAFEFTRGAPKEHRHLAKSMLESFSKDVPMAYGDSEVLQEASRVCHDQDRDLRRPRAEPSHEISDDFAPV